MIFAPPTSLLFALAAFEVLNHALDTDSNSRVLFAVRVEANGSKLCVCTLNGSPTCLILCVRIGASLAKVSHSLQVPALGRHEHRGHQERAALIYLEPFGDQESQHVCARTFVRGSVQRIAGVNLFAASLEPALGLEVL